MPSEHHNESNWTRDDSLVEEPSYHPYHDHVHVHGTHSHAGHDNDSRGVRLWAALSLITLAFSLFEVWGGFAAHSTSLWADALHVSSDSSSTFIGLALALLAQHVIDTKKFRQMGQFFILGSLGIVMVGVLYRGGTQLAHPTILAGGATVMIIALIGVFVNLIQHRLLHRIPEHAHDEIHESTMYHVLNDLALNVAVLLGGAATFLTNIRQIDPAISILVAIVTIIGIFRIALRKELAHSHYH